MIHSASIPWKLYLDDDYEIRHHPEDYIRAYNSQQALELVTVHGLPTEMSLDFDLGIVEDRQDTTMNFLKTLVYDLELNVPFPSYVVHSANPIGKQNIESFIESFNNSLSL